MAIFISYPISTFDPYQPSGLRPSGWYGCFGLIWGMIWKLPYNNLYSSQCIVKRDKRLPCWEIDKVRVKKKQNISPHSEHSAVLPLTPHTISNRQICQKEKCIINRLWYGNFHIIPHINLRPISTLDWYQPSGLRPSGWYGCFGLIWGMI